MRTSLIHLAVGVTLIATSAQHSGAQSRGLKTIHGFLATEKGRKPTSTFAANVPTIYAFWKGESLSVGDTIGVVWIAEDVGEGEGAKETKIRSAEAKVYKPDEDGAFSLSRPPEKNWPVGKYRVQFYLNGLMAEVLKFTIMPGVTIEVPKGDKE